MDQKITRLNMHDITTLTFDSTELNGVKVRFWTYACKHVYVYVRR